MTSTSPTRRTGASCASSGDVVLMLNDDTQVVSPDWIETLLAHLSVPDVGMVGPLLLLADGRIQSAGHYNDRTPHNLGAGALPSEGGPFGMFAVAGERTGITAACAAIRREVYDEVGGLSTTFPQIVQRRRPGLQTAPVAAIASSGHRSLSCITSNR